MVKKLTAAQRAREWRQANPEKSKQIDKDYYYKNRERLLKQKSIYSQTHKEQRKVYIRTYLSKHRDIANARADQWKWDNRKTANVILIGIRARAKRNNLICNLPLLEFKSWMKKEPCCAYCDLPDKYLSLVTYIPINYRSRLTIDRIDNRKGYTFDNITWACFKCNTLKSSVFTAKETKVMAQREIRPLWQAIVKKNIGKNGNLISN